MKRILSFAALLACFAAPAHAYYPEWPRTYFGAHPLSNTFLAADFNSDGRPDLVARTNVHTVLLSLTKADRTFAAPVTIYTGTYLSDMIVGDANGDGKTDVVVSDTATNTLVMLPSNGDATFGSPVTTTLTIAPTEIASADFNDDGDVDLALRSFSGMVVAAFANDGAGHFAETWRTAIDETAQSLLGGDIDGDGADDFIVRRTNPSNQYVMYFGRNDGTFGPAVTTPSTAAPYRFVLGDLDADGDLEIVSTELPSSVNVLVNNGSRTFAAASNYSTYVNRADDAYDVVVAEVTGDAKADVVAILRQSRRIATLEGNGNGTLQTVNFQPASTFTSMFPQWVVAADFTDDGRIDLALAGVTHLTIFANAAGDSTLPVKVVYPTISAGQTAKFEVPFQLAEGFALYYPNVPPTPTGTITLKNGDTPIATGSFVTDFLGSSATIEVPSLPLGTHTITASYAGDANYRPQTSAAVTQKVIAETTVIELTSGTEGTDIRYGDEVGLSAEIVSPVGSTNGSWWLYTNGQRSQYTQSGPTPYWYEHPNDVGTFEYYVSFEGTATQPPAVSRVIRQTVTKAKGLLEIYPGNVNTILRYGDQPEVRLDLHSDPHGPVPEGLVRLYDGATLIATKDVVNNCCSGGITVTFNLPVLPVGVHYIRATYAGSSKFTPAATKYERYTILPAEGFNIDAYSYADGNFSSVGAAGNFTRPDGGYFVIYRKVGNQPWAVYDTHSFYPSISVFDPQPNVLYAFRMEAYNASNQVIAYSNTDATILFPFTKDPIVSGMPVKAQHFQELIDATNIFRSAAGLSALTLSDFGAGKAIRLEHLTTLRASLSVARSAIGLPAIAYSSSPAGSPIQARHLQELRDTMQ